MFAFVVAVAAFAGFATATAVGFVPVVAVMFGIGFAIVAASFKAPAPAAVTA